MHKLKLLAPAAVVAALTAMPTAAAARLAAPRLVGPRNGASFQELPAISWNGVRGAVDYEYQISADRNFRSIIGTTFGAGSVITYNLAGTLDKVVPDGTYFWRVRAVSMNGSAGRWSSVRRIVKRWSIAPRILAGDHLSVSWPQTPLTLRWSSVSYAVKYIVTIATDPALSNQVLGSPSQPEYTDGTSFVLPGTLANGSYFWAVTPVDQEGHRGVRSPVASFTWSWPTSTTPTFTDLDPTIFDPLFSWSQVPGAARYDVEINQYPDFPAGSKWCCSTPTIGTSLAPQQNLANNSTYYYRVRAIDPNGNAGQWNYGGSFRKQFDPQRPSVPNAHMRDASGHALSGVPTTDTPMVTWDPVPGASRYEVTVGDWTGSYCDWSAGSNYHPEMAATGWTPLGTLGIYSKPGGTGWPPPQWDLQPPKPGSTYCVRVLARGDDDAQGQQVVSAWTYINDTNDPNKPSFTYAAQPDTVNQTFSPFTSAGSYICPGPNCVDPVDVGSPLPRTPVLTWNWEPGAKGYFVVISRDPDFTDIADVALTDVPAYVPRLRTDGSGTEPLPDKDSAYYWAVIPTQNLDGSGFNDPFGGNGDGSQDNPQTFNKSSVAPVLLAPDDGANVSTWPTFRWTAAENARDYRIQVSQDPSFGNPIDDIKTDGTAYTSSSTYPADKVLYWRVRADDWNGAGLSWSRVRTFERRLGVPTPTAGNPRSGDGEPVLSWSGVPGAIGYDVHIEQTNGMNSDTNVDSTAFAPVNHYGIGTVHWQVRALFPTTLFTPVGGGFFGEQPYLLTLGPPTGARGIKSGSRLVISWNPDPAATAYEVDVSTSDTFNTLLDFHRVDGTAWAPSINLKLPFNRGRLYWRVAAVSSDGITLGSFATGSFKRR